MASPVENLIIISYRIFTKSFKAFSFVVIVDLHLSRQSYIFSYRRERPPITELEISIIRKLKMSFLIYLKNIGRKVDMDL